MILRQALVVGGTLTRSQTQRVLFRSRLPSSQQCSNIFGCFLLRLGFAFIQLMLDERSVDKFLKGRGPLGQDLIDQSEGSCTLRSGDRHPRLLVQRTVRLRRFSEYSGAPKLDRNLGRLRLNVIDQSVGSFAPTSSPRKSSIFQTSWDPGAHLYS